MEKRLNAGAAALAALALAALAGCGGAPQAARPARPEIHGNLHRVEHGGNVAYIFGSFHLGRPHWFPLGAAVEGAMGRADVFAFEFDLTQMYLVPLITARHIFLRDGMTLREFLPPDVYEPFIANLSTYRSFDYASMRTLTPMTLSALIAMEIFEEMGLAPEHSVDSHVLRFALERRAPAAERMRYDELRQAIAAHAGGAPVIGLNSLESEMALAFDLPDEAQIALAQITLSRAEGLATAQELRMAEMYEAQDMDGFLELRLAMAGADDAFSRHTLQSLIHGRCRIFAAEIARLLRETEAPTTFFVTMGLLHIIGGDADTNVLGLLREAGFEVAPAF